MAAISQVIAQAHLDQWLAADLTVASGQSYSIGNRSLTRADAAEIRQNIDYWSKKVDEASTSGAGTGPIKVFGVTPV